MNGKFTKVQKEESAKIKMEILSKIKPNAPERKKFKKVTTTFLAKINKKLSEARAILGGSGAKDTWLAGNHDIDTFVMFNYKEFASKSAELSDILEPILRKTFPELKIQRVHGSRDYFQLKYQNFDFEVIPILNIKKAADALNITDISPLHAAWVNKNGRKLKDEIRLAKQFFRANNLYGAESYIAGFSGYVLEILTIHYGSLENLLRAAQQWKVKEVIDYSKYYKNKNALFELNKSKLVSPLIVIDPVDKTRNAAAALSKEKFLLLKKIAKKYLKEPKTAFFEKEEISFTSLKNEVGRKKYNLVYLKLAPLKDKKDVAGMKLLKAFNFLKKQLATFSIKKSGWQWEEGTNAFFYFFLAKKELPKFEIRKGPPLELKEFVKTFKKKHRNTFVEGGTIMTKVKITHPKLEDFVKQVLKQKYFQERIKKVVKVTVV